MLDSDENLNYRQQFDLLDISRSGRLTRDSVAQVLSSEGSQLDRLMIALMFEKYDSDGSSTIEFEEFERFCREMEKLSDKEILRQIFDLADEDHNQVLDFGEVKKIGVMMGLSVNDLDSWATIEALDKNSDNLVDFNEFCAILTA
ncbi:EF hand family protein [Tritrichomonas foetus]|uniref:EF hand family protein n=1 Tax=Tritrichomonas foetus TaxID=1144522 RepID=A0A1J4KG13_9EUKA|nr:EF hand family protein [Tritrichomonas foetus]|eukprot:OHT09962.1 EF hand family protein [Tritrichomonas foetus]